MRRGPPRATYRLQLHRGFGLREARYLLPYLDRLGIDTVYLSPILAATPGSEHGYDVVDPTRIDPDRGRPSDLVGLAKAAHARGMRLLLDFVPNHLAASPLNPWWRDVLERGRSSQFARVFDIEWNDADGRRIPISLPVLSATLRESLARREVHLEWDRRGPELVVGELRYPLSPRSLRTIGRALGRRLLRDGRRRGRAPTIASGAALRAELGRAAIRPSTAPFVLELVDEFSRGAEGLPHTGSWPARVLAQQEYRLCPYWEVDRINYRRFFDIGGLVGVRVEDPLVFELTHARLFDWMFAGLLDGVRLDHIDGLANPAAYLDRLRKRLRSLRPAGNPETPLWVEKILGPSESLPHRWPVRGTTGYEALAVLTGLFVDPSGRDTLELLYRERTGEHRTFAEVAFDGKEEVIGTLFPRERTNLARELGSGKARSDRAKTVSERTLAALTAGLPVYRTYERAGKERPEDRAALRTASVAAIRSRPALREGVARLERTIRSWTLRAGSSRSGSPGLRRWQQWTGAVAAKGVEDTALYRYVPFVALNEVGSSPDGTGFSAATFHRFLGERAEREPDALSASSTHDTKWGEETRARLAVLSELPEVWARMVARWEGTSPKGSAGTRGGALLRPRDRYRMLQACVGSFPLDPSERRSFPDRMADYTRKALREARDSTTWAQPSPPYEDAAEVLARQIADPVRGFVTRPDQRDDARRIACVGFWNGLSALVVKATMPGIPDFYQGSERAGLHLVDPDNRRPVDFRAIRRLERGLGPHSRPATPPEIRTWSRRWWDGRLRLYLTRRALAFRRSEPELLARGRYVPLAVHPDGPTDPVAFARVLGPRWAIVVIGRGLGRRGVDPMHPPVGSMFGAAGLELPPNAPKRWRDVLISRESLEVGSNGPPSLALTDILTGFPCALLVGTETRASRDAADRRP